MKSLGIICPACKKNEIFDEGPLCESCLGDVTMGKCLLGLEGLEAKKSTVWSIARSPWFNACEEIIRLRKFALKWG